MSTTMSKLDSDLSADESSEIGFRFEHPAFQKSLRSPERRRLALVATDRVKENSPITAGQAEIADKKSPLTPAHEHTSTRFGRRQPLSVRTHSHDGSAGTPAFVQLANSSARWNKAGRFAALGPPERAERQSDGSDEDPDEVQGDKENRNPTVNQITSHFANHTISKVSVFSPKSRFSGSKDERSQPLEVSLTSISSQPTGDKDRLESRSSDTPLILSIAASSPSIMAQSLDTHTSVVNSKRAQEHLVSTHSIASTNTCTNAHPPSEYYSIPRSRSHRRHSHKGSKSMLSCVSPPEAYSESKDSNRADSHYTFSHKSSSSRLQKQVEQNLSQDPSMIRHSPLEIKDATNSSRVSISPRVLSNKVRVDAIESSTEVKHSIVQPRQPLSERHLNVQQDPIANEFISSLQKQTLYTQSPPPKMVLDNAQSVPIKKGKSLSKIVLNGREYTRLDQIGKGGSSKVFRVMASNGRIFALKRVDFESADQATILGYKSEIDLLKRMSSSKNADRIIRLFDSEINDVRGRLLMLMEAGEIDLAHILAKQQSKPVDFNFLRLYWKHMLEAVQAVHEQNIVHSDLKPANFLLVEGSLKLIDFGIAKAIGNDTMNIHRDTQIGTVNYMSPEALQVTNTTGGRLLKLGRPSDVWSLGCILYQMVYGKTPFSHMTMIQKIQAIPDEAYRIDFPSKALPSISASGKDSSKDLGRTVDGDLLRVMRGCLERDQKRRLTIDDLLLDPFLRPEDKTRRPENSDNVAFSLSQIRELLSDTVLHTKEQIRNKMPISDAEIDSMARDVYDGMRMRRT